MKSTIPEVKLFEYTPPEIGKKIQVTFYSKIPAKISSTCLHNKKTALLFVDENLDKEKCNLVERLINKHVKSLTISTVRCNKKDIKTVQLLWKKMIEIHPDVCIALGGGTICDMVGFASSCFNRGMDHMFFPTTLLSMVDACIGGKTGIDFEHVKNSVGHVHYAVESHCIFPFLQSLERSELMSGVSEVIKAAMLFDSKLFSLLEKTPATFDLNSQWFEAISRSAQLKADISEQPYSMRSKLLYGHNIGHGIETMSSKHKRHGDCVAIGMNYELAIGVVLGITPKEVWSRQSAQLHRLNLPYSLHEIDVHVLTERMKRYRLYKDGHFQFILPIKVGSIWESNQNYYVNISEKKFEPAIQKAIKMIGK